MPHIVVTGMLSVSLLAPGEDTIIYGLPRDEREAFALNIRGDVKDVEITEGKKIKIKGKGNVLEVINRLEKLFGYQVVSHAMGFTINTNQEKMSWTMIKQRKH